MDDVNLYDKNYHMNRSFYPSIKSFANQCEGRVLDVGCGNKPYREYFSIDEYIGIDVISDREPDILADGLNLPFASESFDHVVSFQVLEHVPNPFTFFEEISRVLREDGHAFVSTNQMFNLHMKPNDYFRFTRFGLKELVKKTELRCQEFAEVGNIPVRLCCKINDLYEYILPKKIIPLLRIITNILFSPIIKYDTHEDYIIVSVVLKKSDF